MGHTFTVPATLLILQKSGANHCKTENPRWKHTDCISKSEWTHVKRAVGKHPKGIRHINDSLT